jgi:hypothetical protein
MDSSYIEKPEMEVIENFEKQTTPAPFMASTFSKVPKKGIESARKEQTAQELYKHY